MGVNIYQYSPNIHFKNGCIPFIVHELEHNTAQLVKNMPAMQQTQVPSLGLEDPVEKGLATHSSTFSWRTAWTEEPRGLQSTGLQRV